ncbi:hypothetical protein FRC06_003439 [Ceratobasidium sp. 370]|nr:hypothetical protein FRC06_003439 [Ceratobasidium sp. 370]
MTLAPMLPEEHCERLENIVRLVNKHQAHLPALNERVPWAAPANPPTIIPPNPCRSPPNLLFAPIWATCYFKIPLSMEETIFHVEVWLVSVLKSGVLIHESSGMLFGDDMGVVWIIRVLIKVFLNFVAVKYNISFPSEIPAECDISRLPLSEWPHVLAQLDSWAQRLHDSIAILQRTSEAHALSLPSADDNDDLQSYEPIAYKSTLEPSLPVKQHWLLKKKSKQRLGGLEGSELEASLESEDDSLEDEEMDFDAMDRRGQDSDEESNDKKERDGEGKDSEEDEGEPIPLALVLLPQALRNRLRHGRPCQHFLIYDLTWRTAANEFRMLSDLYTKPLDIDLDLLAAVQHSPVPLLTEYILCRQAIWKRTKSLAQSLFEVATCILESFSTAFCSYATRVDVTGRTLAEARWTWIELQEFQLKATEYLNKLQGNWLAELIPTNLADLHWLVLSQVEWADAFAKKKLTQAKHCQSIWKTAVLLEPFPAQHLSSGMWFAFGNLTDGEEPSGFRDALAQVTEDLAGPRTSAQDAAQELCASPTGTAAPSSSIKTMSSIKTNSPVETALSLVASVASITPTTPAAPATPITPAIVSMSPAPDSATDTVPPCSPTVPSTSLPVPPSVTGNMPQGPAGHKQPARKSNGLDNSVQHISSQHTATPDVNMEARQTRALSARALIQAKQAAEAVKELSGMRGQRKPKRRK